MYFLPKIKDGVIVTPKKKVKRPRKSGLRRNKQNPRALGTNPRAKAKELWNDYYKSTEFIKKL